MNLIQKPDSVIWPITYYIFIEIIGTFQVNASIAWKTLLGFIPEIADRNIITGYLSLYLTEAEVYRAGVSVAIQPNYFPKELDYVKFMGGKYSRFVLKGKYSDVSTACERVFEIVSQEGIEMRNDFCIENYKTSPRTILSQETITEILVPTV